MVLYSLIYEFGFEMLGRFMPSAFLPIPWARSLNSQWHIAGGFGDKKWAQISSYSSDHDAVTRN